MSDQKIDRRKFVQGSTVAAAVSAFPAGVEAAGPSPDKLRIALIGCGGRGTGAAAQALAADDRAELWAMGDIDQKAIDRSREVLKKNADEKRVNLAPEREFTGLDAIDRIVEMPEIDVVILTTPPGFRPFHFEAAVQAGKHVFMEKPVAVDGPGVRKILQGAAEAKAKNLKVGVGFNRRHSPIHHEVISRLHDGIIGDIPWIQIFNCRSDVNKRNPREAGMTELEFQVKNWYYFTWLSGDFSVEQSVHEYDVVRWIKNEANPVKCQGQGGRLVRTGPMNGQIYDHFSIDYEFADGSNVTTQHRHIPKCWSWFGEKIHGTKGSAELSFKRNGIITPSDPDAKGFRGKETGNSYELEHVALFNAIREGREFNEAERGAYGSLFAIMGRMAAYTGKEVTWESALNSTEQIAINPKSWDDIPPLLPDENELYRVPKPGVPLHAKV
ncbi:MAG: Gfo/Idh/MocA family oxidoreductase [Verrucomicrobiales bacterium]|nr:Gfo/Idh/MocA family oxidoreductase [Verrucomicrobiales bacterium]